MTDHEPDYDETSTLIASDKVEGTVVLDMNGEKLGKILNFMVNKHSGQVEYAVMAFGGFLGIGEDHYPIPWQKLRYDITQNGYVVDISKEALAAAPRHDRGDEPVYDATYGFLINDYYGVGR